MPDDQLRSARDRSCQQVLRKRVSSMLLMATRHYATQYVHD